MSRDERMAELVEHRTHERPLWRKVTVRPGQVWADNDKRQDGRYVKVVAIEDGRAVVLPCNSAGGIHDKGRRTRIRLDRFVPTTTGFRFVSDESSGSSSGGTT